MAFPRPLAAAVQVALCAIGVGGALSAAAQGPAPAPAPAASPRATPAASPRPSAPAAGAASTAALPSRAAARVVIEGSVVGPDAKPVVGALVLAQAAVAFPSVESPVGTRTGEQGRFRVLLKPAASYLVRVEAAGLAARTLPRVTAGTPLRVALDRGGGIAGVVRDGSTGAPGASLVVEAREEQVRGVGMTWEPGAGAVRATTDAQGRFRLEGLASGTYTLSARGPGVAAQRRGVPLGRQVELFLFGGGGVGGVVLGPDGLGVTGALIAIESAFPFGYRSSAVERTDGQGRFEVLGLDPGLYRVVARHADHAPAWTTVTVERGSDAQAALRLERPSAIVGRLVGAGERGVPGRVLVAEVDGAGPPAVLAPLLAADAGPDGRFRIEAVPAGTYVLAVTAPGYGARRSEVAVAGGAVAGGAVADVGDVTLESGLVIRGHIRDASGLAIPDARLMLFRERAMGADRFEGRSDADGSFAIGGLGPGLYRVNVAAAGRGSADREVEAGTDGVDIVLDAAGSIAGTVVDERGRPVETFRIVARVPPGTAPVPGRIMMNRPRFEAVSSPEGRFVLDDVAPGTYVVDVTAVDRAPGFVADVKVGPGAVTDVGRVTLGAGGTVRGTVVDPGGAAVAGAVINVRGAGRTPMFLPQDVVSDSAGAFELRGVPSGPIQVTARHPSFAEGAATAEVDPAKEPPEVRIVLLQGGRIEGRARTRDGSPLAGVINVTQRRTGTMFFMPSPIPIAPDGTFVVDHVPPGLVTVGLMTGTGGLFTGHREREVEVLEGQTTTVEFVARDILVRGTVTRAGAPVPNVRVRADGQRFGTMIMTTGQPSAPEAGPQRMSAVTREDGTYEMLVDEPGPGWIQPTSLDGATSYPSLNVEFPDADTFTLDIALPGASLSGTVVDADTEQPIARAWVMAAPKRPAGTRPSGPMPTSSGSSGADGRFRLEVEPGELEVSARAEGYGPGSVSVSASDSGGADVRVPLTRGGSIRGRVVDSRGQGVGGIRMNAVPMAEGAPRTWMGMNQTNADGSFEISGLGTGDHAVIGQSDLGLFAIRSGVSAGSEDVTLTLRRGGRIVVTALGPDGSAVRGAHAFVRRASGVPVTGIGGMMPTDSRGTTEVTVPPGTVEVSVTAAEGALHGTATVGVTEGATVPVEVRLEPKEPAPASR